MGDRRGAPSAVERRIRAEVLEVWPASGSKSGSKEDDYCHCNRSKRKSPLSKYLKIELQGDLKRW